MHSKWLLLGSLFALALFTTSRLVYTLLYIFAAFALLCYCGSKRAYGQMHITRRLSAAKAFIGQEVTVTVNVANRLRFPLGWISLRASVEPNLEHLGSLSAAGLLPQRSEFSMSYRLSGTRRGYYRLGQIRFSGGDPWGWFSQESIYPGEELALTIYPPISPLANLPLPHIRPFGSQRALLRAYEDPTRLSGIREYQPGDSLRRIHWRATARTSTLQVKEFNPTVTTESLILLNLGEESYQTGTWWECGELGIETAASLVVHLQRLGAVYGMAVNGRDPENPLAGPFAFPAAAGAEQAEAMLTLLARLTVAPSQDFADLAGYHSRETGWGTCLFIITPAWDERMTRRLLALRRLGKIPVIMLLHKKDLNQASATGMPVYLIRRDRELGGVRLSREG